MERQLPDEKLSLKTAGDMKNRSPQKAADLATKTHHRIVPRSKKWRIIIITLFSVIVVGGLLWFFQHWRNGMINGIFDRFEMPTAMVVVSPVESTVVTRKLTGIGSVQAIQQVVIASEIGGKVAKIYFEAGSFVEEGTPLVQLDDSQQQAQLTGLQAQLRIAKLNLQRNKTLQENNFVSQAAIDTMETQVDTAQANVDAVQAVIDQKLIRAPFAGELGVRKVDLGQFVAPGTNMVSLTNLSQVFINFTLPEQERGRLQLGQEVTVTSAASAGQKFVGTLTTIEPQVDQVSRQIFLQATLNNRNQRLYPGMYVDVTLGLSKSGSVMTVQETAIDFSLYGESVYRIVKVPADPAAIASDPDSPAAKPRTKVERIVVKTGEHFNGRVEILSGLNLGDLVVAEGQNRLHDQAFVLVSTDKSPLVVPAIQARP